MRENILSYYFLHHVYIDLTQLQVVDYLKSADAQHVIEVERRVILLRVFVLLAVVYIVGKGLLELYLNGFEFGRCVYYFDVRAAGER